MQRVVLQVNSLNLCFDDVISPVLFDIVFRLISVMFFRLFFSDCLLKLFYWIFPATLYFCILFLITKTTLCMFSCVIFFYFNYKSQLSFFEIILQWAWRNLKRKNDFKMTLDFNNLITLSFSWGVYLFQINIRVFQK